MLIQVDFLFESKKPPRSRVIRVFCEETGENPQIVLEDVAAVLLGTSSEHEEAIAFVKDKIQESEITPTIHEELHLVDSDDLEVFYLQSDEVGANGVYETFGKWWNNLRYAIDKDIVHIGELVIQLSDWEQLQVRTRRIFGIENKEYNQPIDLRTWAEKFFSLTVDWTLTAVTTQARQLASFAVRANANRVPDTVRSEENRTKGNIYSPQILVPTVAKVKGLLENPKAFVSYADEKKITHSSFSKDVEKVEKLKAEGKSTDEIIETVWGVTPFSHVVEWEDDERCNYQYDILVAFVNRVKLKKDDVGRSI
jgi:uncharacterized protein YciU (UPF0263 family)